MEIFDLPRIPAGTGYLSGTIVNPVIGVRNVNQPPPIINPNDLQGTVTDIVNIVKNPITKYKETWLDEVVMQAYANILVPESISYTAGTLKYMLSLKVDGTTKILQPPNNTVVSTPSVVITGSLDYVAPIDIYLNGTLIGSIQSNDLINNTWWTGTYMFDFIIDGLLEGQNNIKIVGNNEHVLTGSGNVTVIYQKNQSHKSLDTDDDDDDDEG